MKMSNEKQNGVTRAEDYAAAPATLEHKVKLPSGATFLLRYPRLSFRFKGLALAQTIGARMQARKEDEAVPEAAAAEERAQELAEVYYRILCEVCVSPRVSMTPQEGELHPDRIKALDAFFIARWAGGEIDAEGVDLAAFRGRQSGAGSGDRAGGEDVRPVAERPAEDVPVGSANQRGVLRRRR
jgi:hypothetical protein